MCLAIPARVEQILEEHRAIVCIEDFTPENTEAIEKGEESSFTRLRISTMLLKTPAKIGDYVMVHAGFAINHMSEEEAAETLALFRELAVAQRA